LLFNWLWQPPSLSQERDQGPVATIPLCDLPTEGNSCQFSTPFYCSFTIRTFSHSIFFQLKLLFSQPCLPPSLVHWWKQGPAASIPACDSPTECNDGESTALFPRSFQIFLRVSFFN
jgi:hypothetical protein